MGDRLDRMKAAANNPPVSAPRVTVTPKGPTQGKLVLPKGGSAMTPAKPAVSMVEFVCGHSRPVEIFKNRKCPKCQEETLAKQHRERRESKERRIVRERLPVGSSKVLVWNGEVWLGSLTLPEVSEVFKVEASSEVACCRMLHQVYKSWLKQQGGVG